MDFLGLSNLTIIKNALRIIKRVYDVDVDINTIPLDDEKTFKLLQRGDTTGVFQLESSGMKRYLKELKPTVFDDIIAMAALYRPGPMQFIENFIDRKHGRAEISYFHPKMEDALNMTYGVLVYQEQVMQIAKDLCGFTGGQADTLRKGVAKKKPEVLAKLKDDFISGALTTSGADQRKMEQFWGQLEAFAAYCFPKAHAACYGLIAYQTAYLKAHYPAAFMAALMTSDYDDTDRLSIEISECRHMGVDVLPPDVNESFVEFAVVPKTNQIRFGMAAIKNVGTGAVEEILRARAEGTFENLDDFFSRVNTRVVNRKALDSLVKAGAFDRFGERSLLLHNMDVMLAYASRLQKERASGQVDLFGALLEETATVKPQLSLDTTAVVTFPIREQLVWERELLGLYLSQHPLEAFETLLSEQTIPLNTIKTEHDGKSVSVGGAVTEMREITTKNGQKMGFVKIADLQSEIELILFPSVYQQTVGIWERDRIVFARGKINAKDREGNMTSELKVLVEDAREITSDQAAAYQATGKKKKTPKPTKKVLHSAKPAAAVQPKLYVRVEQGDNTDTLMTLKATIDQQLGDTEVVLVVGPEATKQIIRLPTRVDAEGVLSELSALVGAENVKLH